MRLVAPPKLVIFAWPPVALFQIVIWPPRFWMVALAAVELSAKVTLAFDCVTSVAVPAELLSLNCVKPPLMLPLLAAMAMFSAPAFAPSWKYSPALPATFTDVVFAKLPPVASASVPSLTLTLVGVRARSMRQLLDPCLINAPLKLVVPVTAAE